MTAEQVTVEIAVRRLPHGEGLPLPEYQSDAAAGFDLAAAVADDVPLTLAPGERVAVPTGLALEIPMGFEGQVRPRSGLARRYGLTLVNTPGTIDADYRGEVAVLMVNLGQEAVTIERGMRVAQLVIAPVVRATLVERAALSDTERGSGGFGSTGTGS